MTVLSSFLALVGVMLIARHKTDKDLIAAGAMWLLAAWIMAGRWGG